VVSSFPPEVIRVGMTAVSVHDDYALDPSTEWTFWLDPQVTFSASEIVVFGIFDTIIILGAIALFAPSFPGYDRGSLWPVIIPEHFSERTNTYPIDPYTINHINHGVIVFLIGWIFSCDLASSMLIAVTTAVIWEIEENSEYVINRFRAVDGPNQGYSGDSRINVVFDVLSCWFGFSISLYLGPMASLVLVLVTETLQGLIWRDNLILLTWQSIVYSNTIAEWQLEGIPNQCRNRNTEQGHRNVVAVEKYGGQDIENKTQARIERMGIVKDVPVSPYWGLDWGSHTGNT